MTTQLNSIYAGNHFALTKISGETRCTGSFVIRRVMRHFVAPWAARIAGAATFGGGVLIARWGEVYEYRTEGA